MIDIFRNNAATFYDAREDKLVSLKWRYIAISAASAILTASARSELKDFASLTVAILAIFVGFSFAIIFQIINKPDSPKKTSDVGEDVLLDEDLEDEVLKKKLLKLQKEIFYNLSYFNFISFFASISLLLQSIEISNILENIFGSNLNQIYVVYFLPLGRFVAFFLVIESLSTFYRVSRRITYYFDEKSKQNLSA